MAELDALADLENAREGIREKTPEQDPKRAGKLKLLDKEIDRRKEATDLMAKKVINNIALSRGEAQQSNIRRLIEAASSTAHMVMETDSIGFSAFLIANLISAMRGEEFGDPATETVKVIHTQAVLEALYTYFTAARDRDRFDYFKASGAWTRRHTQARIIQATGVVVPVFFYLHGMMMNLRAQVRVPEEPQEVFEVGGITMTHDQAEAALVRIHGLSPDVSGIRTTETSALAAVTNFVRTGDFPLFLNQMPAILPEELGGAFMQDFFAATHRTAVTDMNLLEVSFGSAAQTTGTALVNVPVAGGPLRVAAQVAGGGMDFVNAVHEGLDSWTFWALRRAMTFFTGYATAIFGKGAIKLITAPVRMLR